MNSKRINEIIEEVRVAVSKLEIEHLCDDIMVAKEYTAIQYAVSKIKEIADNESILASDSNDGN